MFFSDGNQYSELHLFSDCIARVGTLIKVDQTMIGETVVGATVLFSTLCLVCEHRNLSSHRPLRLPLSISQFSEQSEYSCDDSMVSKSPFQDLEEQDVQLFQGL